MPSSLHQIVAGHRAGGSVRETIAKVYADIRAWNDPALFITLKEEAQALAEAEALDAKGDRSLPLFGVPFAVKDNIDVAGLPTTAACPAFAYEPTKSAFIVERLVAAGAIVIGKTNLDQFATGLVGVRSPYGVPRNAVRPDLIPGGSSAGSASAVAAGLVPFALGSDTAGSGRVPAALQGLVGLKPSIGAFSMTGAVPACRSLDCLSVFARNVADARAVYEVAAAFDPYDGYSRAFPASMPGGWPPGLRIGVPRAADRIFFGDLVAERAFDEALAAFKARGAKLVEIDMSPLYATAKLLYEGPWVAERYLVAGPLLEKAPEALHPVTAAIIGGAKRYDAGSVFSSIYKLMDLRRVAAGLWSNIDVLAVPTIPTVYTVKEVEADPVRLNSNLGTYTNFVNLLDMAALAVPTASRSDGLPAGVTFIAPAGRDAFLAGLGLALEGAPGTGSDLSPDMIEIAVVGAHLSGLPLNGQLVEKGAVFRREGQTVENYRLVRLPGGPPVRPGLIKVAPGEGTRIAVEVWALPTSAVGAFLAQIPAPLGLGTLTLVDGTSPKGFICEADGARGATDISSFGGWRAYLASLA